jgi:hypothetical protein
MTFDNILAESGSQKDLVHHTSFETIIEIFKTGGLLFQEYPYSKTDQLEMCTVRSEHHPNTDALGTFGQGAKILIQFDLLNDYVRGIKTRSTNEFVLQSKKEIAKFGLEPYWVTDHIDSQFVSSWLTEHCHPYFGFYDVSGLMNFAKDKPMMVQFNAFCALLPGGFSRKESWAIFRAGFVMLAYQIQREYEERIYIKKKDSPVEIIKVPFDRINAKNSGAIKFDCNYKDKIDKKLLPTFRKYIIKYPNLFTEIFKQTVEENSLNKKKLGV